MNLYSVGSGGYTFVEWFSGVVRGVVRGDHKEDSICNEGTLIPYLNSNPIPNGFSVGM